MVATSRRLAASSARRPRRASSGGGGSASAGGRPARPAVEPARRAPAGRGASPWPIKVPTAVGPRPPTVEAVASRFAADAVIRRVDAEGSILLGGGRALLLQLAHPKVAAGVAEHSDFEGDPLRRLRGTLEATYTIVFGTDEAAAEVADRVQRIHAHVTGPGYEANDPDAAVLGQRHAGRHRGHRLHAPSTAR